ncbi:unnamed protein product [[Candida] boidinii]|uniref:Unnamed protein product n=1 Tax=Candida boidinii TaxID=5477 RepID=A0ACB5TLV8_CANBO|nr:unnamed protein product [[Candida] boidinii]
MDYYLSTRPKLRHLHNNVFPYTDTNIKDIASNENNINSHKLSTTAKRQLLVNKLRNRLFDYEPGASIITDTPPHPTPNKIIPNNLNVKLSPMKDISNLKSIKLQNKQKLNNNYHPSFEKTKKLDSFNDINKINNSLSKITINKNTISSPIYNRFNNINDKDIINERIKKLFEKVKYELNSNEINQYNNSNSNSNPVNNINKLKIFIKNQELIIKNLNKNQINLINKIKLIEKNNKINLNNLNYNKLLKFNNYEKKIELLIKLINNLLYEFKNLKFENKKLINNLNSIELNDIELNDNNNKYEQDTLNTINLISLNLQNYNKDSNKLNNILNKIENFENKFNDSNDIDTNLELYSNFINDLEKEEEEEEEESDDSGIITDTCFHDFHNINEQYENDDDSIDLINLEEDDDSTYDLLNSNFKEFNIQLNLNINDIENGKESENLSKFNFNSNYDYDNEVLENTEDLLKF